MIRGIHLRSAVGVNVAAMTGAGPLITIPLVVAALHGSPSLWPWIAGAAIALCDGLCFAELASLYPRSGGTYVYLREAFGPRAGPFLAFLYIWQFMFSVPLVAATGFVGFAQYAAYLWPGLAAPLPAHVLAVAVGAATLIALYRAIPLIARTALVLGTISLGTLAAVALTGIVHPLTGLATVVAHAAAVPGYGLAAFGAALVITLYDYAGYYTVCALGDEVVAPIRTIPLAVVLSIAAVVAAYVALNLGIFSALPVGDITGSHAVASLALERAFGPVAATVVTVAILVTIFAAGYGALLGNSRIPYAAALDGNFFSTFARLHPRLQFPHRSLLVLGLLALPAALLPLDAVINALTAGLVLVGGVAVNLAPAAARARGARAAFRVPLFPLPALVAGAAWLFLFWSSGPQAMLFGGATLGAGALVFAVRGRMRRVATAAAALTALLVLAPAARDAAPAAFGAARVGLVDGAPTLLVDGQPFFFFGGAFFYPRIPPEQWRTAMLQLRDLGVNTLDLYVPWNWHEVDDGQFDFDGHTNPRRNLREVLRLARSLGFHLIVRPGPVIRNEWRNGGYPAWLLKRPDYHMPLHDVLEGRYPATATLQNARSDSAAAEWLHNPTHLRYAARWLRTVTSELRPFGDRVLALQLDDDQGAYLDNETWPAPHFRSYMHWIEDQLRAGAGPTVPTYINTFDMKVPASAPAWAMGNWYQGGAFKIGEHDRTELDFATALLTTQENVPLAYSEFQAGWLAAPEDPQPRGADPTNTTLALAEILGWGAHGTIVFPLADTLAPFGWEAPFANAFYAWNAALPRDPEFAVRVPDRRAPIAAFGATIRDWGPLLAATHRSAQLAIAYAASGPDPRTLDQADVATISARFKDALRSCAERGLTCDAVDLRYTSDARLRRYRTLVIPPVPRPLEAMIERRVAALRNDGVAIVDEVPEERGLGIVALAGTDASFGVASNWSDAPLWLHGPVRFDERSADVDLTLPPRSARLIVLDLKLAGLVPGAGERRITTTCRLIRVPNDVVADGTGDPCTLIVRDGALVRTLHPAGERLSLATLTPAANVPAEPPAPGVGRSGAVTALGAGERIHLTGVRRLPRGTAQAYATDAFGRGDHSIVLQNDRIRAIFAPDGGARLVVLQRIDVPGDPLDAVNATGALRDDVLVQPPPSKTDRIARYTHSYAAGTFNRSYTVEILAAGGPRAAVRFSYDAPDVLPAGARFVKTVSLAAGATRLVIDERVRFAPGTRVEHQRAVVHSALAVTVAPRALARNGEGAEAPIAAADLDPRDGIAAWTGELAIAVTWQRGAVERATWTPYRSNGTLTLVAAPRDVVRTTIGLALAKNADEAFTFARAEHAWVSANPPESDR